MSRRKRRPGAADPVASSPEEARSRGAAGAAPRPTGARGPASRPTGQRASRRLALDIGILVAVFAVTVGISELAGAANLGTAMSFGQIGFGLAAVYVLVRR